ncbi:MAG: transcriptional regulator [Myxococcales bacterium]|nr:transcriptional regulator [Myxococcales bacterium]
MNRNDIHGLSELFKSLSDPTRVRILHALTEQDEWSVGELAEQLDISQSALSHQLRVLRAHQIVTYRRDGKQSFYRIKQRRIIGIMAAGLNVVQA